MYCSTIANGHTAECHFNGEAVRLYSQFFHVGKSKKGPIHKLSDAVPLHLQRLQ